MEELIVNITSYLQFLNENCNIRVSVHFDSELFYSMPKNAARAFLEFNTHLNPYCILVKASNHKKCLLNQKNILKKLDGCRSICSVCHAEVEEYVYPILKNDFPIGFIAVSGYKPKEPDNEKILNRRLWEMSLENEIPYGLCDAVIPPLSVMLEKFLTSFSSNTVNDYNLIIQFLNEYHTNITLSHLSKHLKRSPSHISHLFKKESGMSIRVYCNNLKLEDAKRLLLTTDFPITEIALEAGFCDTSYFISLFKKKYGITPHQYRLTNK